jgi:hypothetical protein
MGNRIVFNTNRSVQTSQAPIPDSSSVGLTVTVFNSLDITLHFLSSISAPVGVAVALAGLSAVDWDGFLNRIVDIKATKDPEISEVGIYYHLRC